MGIIENGMLCSELIIVEVVSVTNPLRVRGICVRPQWHKVCRGQRYQMEFPEYSESGAQITQSLNLVPPDPSLAGMLSLQWCSLSSLLSHFMPC